MTEPRVDPSNSEEQSRQAIGAAIALATELESLLFIAVRYRGSAEVNCFTCFTDPRLIEFLTGCARYAFRAADPDPIYKGSSLIDVSEIDDSEMRLAIEHAFIRATFCANSYFSGLLMPIVEDPVRKMFKHVELSITSPETQKHLSLCLEIAAAACLYRSRNLGE